MKGGPNNKGVSNFVSVVKANTIFPIRFRIQFLPNSPYPIIKNYYSCKLEETTLMIKGRPPKP